MIKKCVMKINGVIFNVECKMIIMKNVNILLFFCFVLLIFKLIKNIVI